jgi:predicted amidohydrolase
LAENGGEHMVSRPEEFRITERYFSSDEGLPSIGIANIHAIVPDVEANKAKMVRAIEMFKDRKANLAIFPEFCLSGYFWDDQDACRQYMDQAVIENHRGWVRGTLGGLLDDTLRAIIFNNVRKGAGGKYYNSTYVVSPTVKPPESKIIYDKVFLPGIERDYTETGKDDRLVIDTRFGRIGFTTCYDILFPQLVLEYSRMDKVDAIIELASWRAIAVRDYVGMNVGTDTYYGSLWDMMLPATAAMHQIWVIACNAVGRHAISGAAFWGGSGLWAPSGLKLLQASHIHEELLVIHNVNIKRQRQVERDEFDYAVDFDAIYRPVAGKRTFTRIKD